MKIEKTLETEDGNVEFKGEVNQDELDLIISVGLNYLLQQGAIPFKMVKNRETSLVGPGSDSKQ